MKDFFQSTKFKILAAVFVVLCAFMLRATMSGGLTPLTSQLLSVVTTPLQSAASGISESVGGLYRHLFQAGRDRGESPAGGEGAYPYPAGGRPGTVPPGK